MSAQPKALMTQYAEGSIVSQGLQDMLANSAADARFDRDFIDDIDLYVDRYSNTKYRNGRNKNVAGVG